MKEQTQVNERNYGIDLFRFFSMLMIVILHVLGHGGVLHNGNSFVDKTLIYFLEIMCIVAVNCFALISGYVNFNKKFSIKRLLYLWLQCFFPMNNQQNPANLMKMLQLLQNQEHKLY